MDDLFTRAAAAAPPPLSSPSPWSNDVVEWHGRIDGGPIRVAVGRFGQTIARLHDGGEAGISSLHFPGLRLSHYIKVLRDDYGVNIETVREPHGGDDPGRHGRYILRSRLEVVKVVRAGEVKAKRRTSAGKVGGRRDVAA
jgi:hypothetical protein